MKNLKMLAVIERYKKDAKNMLLCALQQPYETEKLEERFPAGEIKISENEVSRLIGEAVSQGLLYNKPAGDLIREAITINPRVIAKIDNPSEEEQLIALKYPKAISCIKQPTKAVRIKYLLSIHPDAVWLGYMRADDNAFRGLSEKEIVEIAKQNPDAIVSLPEDMVTENIVYYFLEAMVKGRHEYLMSVFSNISEKFRNKMFYQCFCMVNGYNYSLLTEEQKKVVITPKLIDYTLSKVKSYVSTVWMYKHLPECLKTKEISIRCVIKHPWCMEYLPSQFRNQEFYEELLAAAMEVETQDAIAQRIEPTALDWEKAVFSYKLHAVPENTAKKLSEKTILALGDKKYFSLLKTDESFDELARRGFLGDIPKEKMTEDRILASLYANRRSIRDVPPDLFTDKIKQAIRKDLLFDSVKYLPDELKEEGLIIKAIEARHIRSIADTDMFSPSVVEAFVMKNEIPFFDVAPALQTEAMCKKVLADAMHKSESAWFYTLKKCKYRTKAEVDYAIETLPQAITLPDLTDQQIIRGVKKFPENRLYVPRERMAEIEKILCPPQEDEVEEKSAAPEESAKQTTSLHVKTWEQLSLFDILGTYA